MLFRHNAGDSSAKTQVTQSSCRTEFYGAFRWLDPSVGEETMRSMFACLSAALLVAGCVTSTGSFSKFEHADEHYGEGDVVDVVGIVKRVAMETVTLEGPKTTRTVF